MRRFGWAVAVSAVVPGSDVAAARVPETIYKTDRRNGPGPAAAVAPDPLPPAIIQASGAEGHHHPPRPLVLPPNCPPGPGPYSPMPPVVPPKSTDPDRPPAKDPTAPAEPPTARAPEAGTQPAAALNPNMFGDFFGGAGNTRLLFAPTPGAFQATGDLFFTPTRLVGGGSTGAPTVAVFSPNASGSSVTVASDGFGGRTFGQFPLLTGDVRQQLISPGAPSTFLVNRQTTNIFSVLIDPINNTPAGRMAMAGVLNSVKGPNGPVLTSIDSISL